MWLSLVERCVRDAETARSNRAIPTTEDSRVCFTANPFFVPYARRKKKESFQRRIPLPRVDGTAQAADTAGFGASESAWTASQMHGALV